MRNLELNLKFNQVKYNFSQHFFFIKTGRLNSFILYFEILLYFVLLQIITYYYKLCLKRKNEKNEILNINFYFL